MFTIGLQHALDLMLASKFLLNGLVLPITVTFEMNTMIACSSCKLLRSKDKFSSCMIDMLDQILAGDLVVLLSSAAVICCLHKFSLGHSYISIWRRPM